MKWILTISMMTVMFPFSALSTEINGNWARGDGNARVKIAECGKDICATNIWIKPGTPKEKTGDRLVMSIKETADGH